MRAHIRRRWREVSALRIQHCRYHRRMRPDPPDPLRPTQLLFLVRRCAGTVRCSCSIHAVASIHRQDPQRGRPSPAARFRPAFGFPCRCGVGCGGSITHGLRYIHSCVAAALRIAASAIRRSRTVATCASIYRQDSRRGRCCPSHRFRPALGGHVIHWNAVALAAQCSCSGGAAAFAGHYRTLHYARQQEPRPSACHCLTSIFHFLTLKPRSLTSRSYLLSAQKTLQSSH